MYFQKRMGIYPVNTFLQANPEPVLSLAERTGGLVPELQMHSRGYGKAGGGIYHGRRVLLSG